ncbi:unnamed protein product [Linum trigynum]
MIDRHSSRSADAGNTRSVRPPPIENHGKIRTPRAAATPQEAHNLSTSSVYEQTRRRRLILEAESEEDDPFLPMHDMAHTSPLGKSEMAAGNFSQHANKVELIPPPQKPARGIRTSIQTAPRDVGARKKG